MNNFDKLKEDISTEITSKTTLTDLIIEVDKIKKTLNTLIDLIKRRAF